MRNLELKAGDCFLVHSHGWLAKAIDAVEAFWDFGNKRLYSHAGIIVQDNGLTLEALQPRVTSQFFPVAYQGTPIFEFEAEWLSAVKPDIAKFCPLCREPLKARAG